MRNPCPEPNDEVRVGHKQDVLLRNHTILAKAAPKACFLDSKGTSEDVSRLFSRPYSIYITVLHAGLHNKAFTSVSQHALASRHGFLLPETA